MMYSHRFKKTRWRYLSILLPGLLLLPLLSPPLSAGLYSTEYDSLFKRWSHRWLPHLKDNSKWIKSQAVVESNLDPAAVSPAGALGIMQIMPRTAMEIRGMIGMDCSPLNARCGIIMGTFYDRRMYKTWDRRGRTQAQVIPLMFASYNMGTWGVIKAQDRCGNPLEFTDFKLCLPLETQQYPGKIAAVFETL